MNITKYRYRCHDLSQDSAREDSDCVLGTWCSIQSLTFSCFNCVTRIGRISFASPTNVVRKINTKLMLEHRYIHAMCNFRMDQDDRFIKEISRVEDVLHRTRPFAKTKNKTLLWHFPFLRDGHCRIYESSANKPMTRLCHDKSMYISHTINFIIN